MTTAANKNSRCCNVAILTQVNIPTAKVSAGGVAKKIDSQTSRPFILFIYLFKISEKKKIQEILRYTFRDGI